MVRRRGGGCPCSGEGMFRKMPEAREAWSEGEVVSCAARQLDILKAAWPALKPGGLLIYSTCTFNHAEDESVAERFSEWAGEELEPVDAEPLPEEWGSWPARPEHSVLSASFRTGRRARAFSPPWPASVRRVPPCVRPAPRRGAGRCCRPWRSGRRRSSCAGVRSPTGCTSTGRANCFTAVAAGGPRRSNSSPNA